MALSADISVIFPLKSLRVIPFDYYPGAINMAIDYFLAKTIQLGDDPILRFYGWKPFCLSLGYHQDSSKVKIEKLKEKRYDVVRRPTGGSAIFHGTELTYSLIVPFAKRANHQIYSVFHYLYAEALKSLGYGVEIQEHEMTGNYLNDEKSSFACFDRPAFNEIKYNGKKVVGSAQKVFSYSLLQHGSLILSGTQSILFDFLNVSETEIKEYKYALHQRSCSLDDINSREVDKNEICDGLIEQFAKNGVNSIYYQNLSKDETAKAKEIVNRFVIK